MLSAWMELWQIKAHAQAEAVPKNGPHCGAVNGEVYPVRIIGYGQTSASTIGWLSRALRRPEALGLHLRWTRYSNGSEHGDCSSGTTHPNPYLA